MIREKNYQEIVFSLDRYSWKRTPEEANEAMWEDIKKLLNVLFANEYIAVIYQDEVGIVVVQFEHDERRDAWGCANPYWLTEDEYFEYLHSNEEPEENEYSTTTSENYSEFYELKKNEE